MIHLAYRKILGPVRFVLAAVLMMGMTTVVFAQAPTSQPAASQPTTQPAAEAGDKEAGKAMTEKVIAAYAKTKTYQSIKQVRYFISMGARNREMKFVYETAFDRDASKLVADSEQIRILAADGHVQFYPKPQGAHYVKAKVDDHMDAAQIIGVWNMFDMLVATPDISLLLGGEQVKMLREDDFGLLPPEPNDKAKRPRLRMTDENGSVMTMWLDPKTHLILDATVRASNGQIVYELDYNIQILKKDKPIDPSAFAFDPGEAEALPSVQAFAAAMQQSAQANGPHLLHDKPAPPIELKTLDNKQYKLANDKADIVVLDFWATWCGPCIEGLPHLQRFADWAKSNKKSVAVYAINQEEDKQTIEAFWKQQGLTMPVLLDTDSAVGRAYRVGGIPQTVVIHKGKVVATYVGLRHDMEDLLKQHTNDLLGS